MNENLKIVAFSDTHGQHRKVNVPDGDILIFAGDAMSSGYSNTELLDFLSWFNNHPHEIKIMIAGNHDRIIELMPDEFRKALLDFPSITYLENEGVTVAGVNIWGTPDTKEFYNWAFNRTHEELVKSFAKIPGDTDILVSHGPIYGVLDQVSSGEHCGEKELADQVKDMTIGVHIFGHIHEGAGSQYADYADAYNVSQVNERYELVYKPTIIPYEF